MAASETSSSVTTASSGSETVPIPENSGSRHFSRSRNILLRRTALTTVAVSAVGLVVCDSLEKSARKEAAVLEARYLEMVRFKAPFVNVDITGRLGLNNGNPRPGNVSLETQKQPPKPYAYRKILADFSSPLSDVFGEISKREVQPDFLLIGEAAVTIQEWRPVREWAKSHGYAFECEGGLFLKRIEESDDAQPQSGGGGGGVGGVGGVGGGALGGGALTWRRPLFISTEYGPAVGMNWYDAVKWCNAKSEMEGLRPCYYTSDRLDPSEVYRVGEVPLTAQMVDWNASGYRLPTETEWERAFGELVGDPTATARLLGNQPSPPKPGPSRNGGASPKAGHPRAQLPEAKLVSAPRALQVYGVWEWCWNWAQVDASRNRADMRGPDSGSFKVVRDGTWSDLKDFKTRSESRPDVGAPVRGFRMIRGATTAEPETRLASRF